MKKLCYFFALSIILSGCATKMVYLNTQKPLEEVKKDKADCQSIADNSGINDPGLRQKKIDECMKDKGYNVVSEKEAEKIQGFNELWIKPGADFKSYEAIFINQVDVNQAKANNKQNLAEGDINSLGEQMFQRFSRILSVVIPVISDKKEAEGKKILYLSLKLNNISETNVGANVALGVAGTLLPVPAPTPDAPEGAFSFEGTITDDSGREKLIVMSDEVKSNRNSSLMGFEKFSHWQRAYDIMDYWADRLAQLLAKKRGQEYKSQLKMKII